MHIQVAIGDPTPARRHAGPEWSPDPRAVPRSYLTLLSLFATDATAVYPGACWVICTLIR